MVVPALNAQSALPLIAHAPQIDACNTVPGAQPTPVNVAVEPGESVVELIAKVGAGLADPSLCFQPSPTSRPRRACSQEPLASVLFEVHP